MHDLLKNSYHICNFIFFPPSSTVFILKSIPESHTNTRINKALNFTNEALNNKTFISHVSFKYYSISEAKIWVVRWGASKRQKDTKNMEDTKKLEKTHGKTVNINL